MHALVLVSGGGAVTPFTTPDAAAPEGLAAGNSLTAIRSHLLDAGHVVFTAPAGIGGGPVEADTGWQGFSRAPIVLPAAMTVNAVGRIDDAGTALHQFLRHLAADHGVETIDIVGHSMGGLFSRAALAHRTTGDAPSPRLERLVTIGTPWTGSLLGDYEVGDISLADANGDAATVAILEKAISYAGDVSEGAAEEASRLFLDGVDGWNSRQRGVLSGVAVTAIAGTWFSGASAPTAVWPHDGLVALRSASAKDVPADVAALQGTHTLDDLHSIFFADLFDQPWERALTWDPRVFAIIDDALTRGETGQKAAVPASATE